MLFGTLQTDPTKAAEEYAAGVRYAHMDLAWTAYETSNGTFDATYISQQQAKRDAFLAAGLKVVLGVGIQYPPAWAYNDFSDSRYKNQYGVESALNTTFNQLIRTQVEQYITRVNSDLGLNNFDAVRIGSGHFIETVFPGMDDGINGDNCYWGWDANASGGANRPSTIPTRPHAAWVPGSTSITTGQVAEWLDWYLDALVDGIDWQIAYYKSLGFTGLIHVCMPGLGTRPIEVTDEINAYLDGSADGNRTLGRGAVYDQIVDKISDKANVVVYESGLADFSGVPANNLPTIADQSVSYLTDPAVTLWSGTRWKVFNARRYGMSLAGENPGYVDSEANYGLAMMIKAGEMADVGGLYLVMWAHDENLYSPFEGGVSLAQYSTMIQTWGGEGGGGGGGGGGGATEPIPTTPPVSTAPAPSVPSPMEAEIYRGQNVQFQIKALIRLDFPVFSGNVFDGFDGTELNSNYWYKFSPSWGLLEVSGGEAQFGTSSPGISESYFVTKPNIWFPKRTDTDWALQFRMRVDSYQGYGTFIDLISLQQYRSIMRLEANTNGLPDQVPGFNGGLSIQIPARTQVMNLGFDTSYNTFRVVYTAASKQYEFFVDQEGGAGFTSIITLSAVNNRADLLVFGNAGIRQGGISDWTLMTAEYVSMIGTEETFDVPEWASPQYLYDQLQYDNELWSELPSVIRGRIDSRKSNEADTLELDLVNFTILDKGDPTTRLYTHFSFMNRFIKILSRVNDGFTWTPWRQIFLGSCDEKNIEIKDTGETMLTLRARDWVRKRLAETRVIRAYSDYGDVVEGLYMNMDCAEIMQDIAQNVCGLPFTALQIPATPYNTPRTLNIAGDPASQVITNLMQGLGFTWWCNHATGQIFIQPLPMGTDTPAYWLSTDGEVKTIQWNQSSLEHVAAIEFGISNTEFQNGGFSVSHPITPVPFFGRIELVDAVIAQSDVGLNITETPQRVYMQSIRELGSVRVGMSCQDWLEHNIEIGLIDNTYLGIAEKDGPWLIDGWTHEWEGTAKFDQEVLLVKQHPDEVVREALSEHVFGIP